MGGPQVVPEDLLEAEAAAEGPYARRRRLMAEEEEAGGGGEVSSSGAGLAVQVGARAARLPPSRTHPVAMAGGPCCVVCAACMYVCIPGSHGGAQPACRK